MPEVVMSANPKKIRTFIINGQMYEGGAEDYFSGRAKPIDVGGTGSPDGVLPQGEGQPAEKAE